jgi:NitT/TauT family transport system substrate-binding protein
LHGPEWIAVAVAKGADADVIANVANGAAVWIAACGTSRRLGQMPATSTSLFFKLLLPILTSVRVTYLNA